MSGPMRQGEKERLFEGGGETGELMSAFDWAGTPVGRVAGWSQALRTVVGLLLKNRFALILMWGLLIAGVSPHREIDEAYRGFFELVAGQIETAIRNARAYENLYTR